MIHTRYVVEFSITTIQGNLEVDTQLFSCLFRILRFQLGYENPLCSLIVDGWRPIVFGEMPGSRSLFCKVEDIENFASVLYTAKRSGGDLGNVIQKVARMLGDKIDVKKEIKIITARTKR